MRFMLIVSDLIMPLTFVIIIFHGLSKKVPVFDTFIEGTKEGFQTIIGILPTIIGLMVAVGVFRASGALTLLSQFISPFTNAIGYPTDAVPITFMRLISSSASMGLLSDIFKTYGPDSFMGRFVSVMMSSTETVFYTLSIYFMSVKITKTRYTLQGALIANFAGIVASLYITIFVFGGK